MEAGASEVDRRASCSAAGLDKTPLAFLGARPRAHEPTAANSKYYNPVVMSFIRDDWVKQQLRLRQSAYTELRKTRIVTGTWNVNAKKPLAPSEAAQLVQWLQSSGANGELPDIVALGFQEVVDLNAVNVVVNSNPSAQRSAAWEEVLLTALNQHLAAGGGDRQYKILKERHLVGILLLVFVRLDHVDHVRDQDGATAGVGIMGVMGNKGGAAIRLMFYGSSLCFCCAHLAAHRENVTGRNADYQNILSKIEFGGSTSSYDGSSSECAFSSGLAGSSSVGILSHDFVFWLGDLNYRIQDDVAVDEVFRLSEGGPSHWAKLSPHDQLNIERRRGNVLKGFEEGPLLFAPTYKYQAGRSIYEKRPEKKLRAPAWCDRILWKAKTPAHVELLAYNAVPALDLSDHKPVHAFFDVQITHQVESKKTQVLREIMMQLDKWENENMPRVKLLQSDGLQPSSGVVGFTHVRYGVQQTKTLVVENTGLVVAHFRFIPKLEEVTVCKPWLHVSPTFGMIPPREKLVIRLTTLVDDAIAHGLSSGEESLDDTMIMRIENGRDYFIVVSGQYDNSCFGTTLEQLITRTEPVRHVKVPTHGGSRSPNYPTQQRGNGGSAQKIPKELWRVVNDIYEHAMDDVDLFLEPGDQAEIVQLREALDTGHEFPVHRGSSTAELLVSWLQSLRESVIPDEILVSALANGHANVAQTCRLLLDQLSPLRFNVLIYLISFLKELLNRRQINRSSPEALAAVFSSCLVSQPHIQRVASKSADDRCSLLSAPLSSASTVSTSYSSSGSNQSALGLLIVDDRSRRSTCDSEQTNASQQWTEAMQPLLLYWLTTSAL